MAVIRLEKRIIELDNKNNALVLLVRNGNHALLALVTMDNIQFAGVFNSLNSLGSSTIMLQSDTITMEVFDFLPAGNIGGSSSSDIGSLSDFMRVVFQNPSCAGYVRARKAEHRGVKTMHISELWRMFKFEDSGLDAEYLFWECEPDDYSQLKESINLDIENPPRFSLGGSQRFFSANGHNCYTWAKEQLTTIGIELETTLWDRLIAAEPINHIQPSNIGCLIF